MPEPEPITIPDEFYSSWSFSKIDAASCPERLLRAYVLEDPPSWQPEVSVLGRVVHEVVELYGAHCYTKGVPRDDSKVHELVEQFETASPDAVECFERWAQKAEWDWQNVIVEGGSVERYLSMDVGGRGTFSGKLDRVTRDAEAKRVFVRDYKSSWHPKPYDPEKPPLQLLVYGLLACEQYPDTTELVLQIEYIRKGIVHEWRVEPPLTWAQNHLEGRIARTIDVAEEAAGQEQRRRLRPGGACSYCDFLVSCPIDKLSACSAAYNNADAAEMWALANALKAKGAAIAKAVKEYVSEADCFQEGGDSVKVVDLWPPQYCGPAGTSLRVVKGCELDFLREAQSAGARVSKMVKLSGAKVVAAVDGAGATAKVVKAIETAFAKAEKVSEEIASALTGGLSGESVIRAIEHEGEVDLQQYTEEYTPSLTLAAREPEPESDDEEDGDNGPAD